jgi:hypothetical protein
MPNEEPRVGARPKSGARVGRGGRAGKPPRAKAGAARFDRAKRRERSLAAIGGLDPGLARRLAEYKPRSELIFDKDGNHNVGFGERKLYERPLVEHARDQVARFWTNPARLVVAPVQPTHLDRQAGQFLHNILKRGHERGVTFQAMPKTRRSELVVVFGIGLAAHLDPLVEDTDCRFLVLVEPNLEFLHHSLGVYDWAGLIKRLARKRGRLLFFVGIPPVAVDEGLRGAIRVFCPCAFDGMVIFTHYPNTLFDQVMNLIQKNAAITVSGFGFVDDEIFMLRNTYANLSAGDARLTQRTGARRIAAPIFLVGSGPSLDRMYEDIRRNADRAVIFSCGTGIRPLLQAGIVPDLHLEIERNVEVVPLIEQAAREFDLSPICLVVTTTVDPRIPLYFKKKVYYFRAALSCTPIFAPTDECQPGSSGPTVVNAALGVAQDVGFRQVYFFGVDLGTRVVNPKVRHSAHSWQNTVDGFEDTKAYDMPVPGNFGGKVYSNRDLLWTMSEVENAIRHWGRGRFYYNCSDGARIKGVTPRLAGKLRLPPIPGGKEKVLADLMATFPAYTQENLKAAWTDERARKEIRDYIGKVKAVLKKRRDLDDKRYLLDMQQVFLPPDAREHAWAMVYRGTLLMALTGAEYYMRRSVGDPKFGAFKTIVREELFALTDLLKKETLDALGRLSETAPALRKI